MSEFAMELSQNKYLAPSDAYLHAVLTVRATGGPGSAVTAAEVLLVDCSSSMDWPPTKIAAARRAAAAAVDTLRDGTLFAIVQGTGRAAMVYPDAETLVPADAGTRSRAKAATSRLIASGGTAMSTWLAMALRLLDGHPAAVRHALLLTDGRNESEPAERLHRVLDACEGRFTCDARGIGDDWEPGELRRIVSVLRGTADAVVDEADLAEDFRGIVRSAMGKAVPDLRLRIVTPPFSRVEFVKQVFPTELDLTDRCLAADGGGLELSTGSWGEETREYHLCLAVRLAGRPRFEDLQLGRVELLPVAGAAVRVPEAPVPILGHVTDDVTLSTRIDDRVEHYTVQGDLGRAMRDGWAWFERGDRAGAAREWGRAVRLATRLGNAEILRRLHRLVEVEDAERGAVRIRDGVRPRDGFSLVLGSSIATAFGDPVDRDPPPRDQPPHDAPARRCPSCDVRSPAAAVVCQGCGQPFDREVAP